MSKSIHTVINPVQLDGKRYVAGDEVHLTPAQAKRLQELGAVGEVLPDVAKEKPAAPDGPTDPDERAEAIRAAAEQLGEGDLTNGGEPKISALEKILGWKPVRDEVAAAMPAPPAGD